MADHCIGNPFDTEVPTAYHLNPRALGAYLVNVNCRLQSSTAPGAVWRLVDIPVVELHKVQPSPLNTR